MNYKGRRAKELYVLSSCIVLALILRWPYMFGPADLDEGNYACIGMMVARGAVLYKDIGDSKPPIIYFINALITTLFGSDLLVLRLTFSIVAALTGFFIYLAARMLYKEKYAIIATLLFTVFSSSAAFGFYSPTNVYSSLMETVAIYFLLISLHNGQCWKYVITGVFIGLSTLVRQTGIFVFVAIVTGYSLALIIKFLDSRRMLGQASQQSDVANGKEIIDLTFKQTIKNIILIIIGIGAIFAPFLVYFYSESALGNMIYWIILQPSEGIQIHMPWTSELKIRWVTTAFYSILPLFPLGVIGTMHNFKSRFMEKLLFVFWIVICISFFLLGPVPAFTHYYYQILPPLCLLAGGGVAVLFHRENKKSHIKTHNRTTQRKLRTIAKLHALLAIAILTILTISTLFSLFYNFGVARDYVNRDDVRVATEIAQYIKSHTSYDDKIFVFESQWARIGPLIYYLSERLPSLPRPFFFTYVPEGITNSDVTAIEQSLVNEDVKYVVLIGSNPPVNWNSMKILLAIFSNYFPVYVARENYAPYPWLSPTEVAVYERVDMLSDRLKHFVIDNGSVAANVVSNPSFDLNESEWVPWMGMNVARDTNYFMSDPASGRVSGNSGAGSWNYIQYAQNITLFPNLRYRLGAWVKVDNVSDVKNGLVFRIEQRDEQGKWIANIETKAYNYSAIGTWQYLTWDSKVWPLSQGAYYGRLLIGKTNSSPNNITFYIDDVELRIEPWSIGVSEKEISATLQRSDQSYVQGTESLKIVYNFGNSTSGWITLSKEIKQDWVNLSTLQGTKGLSFWLHGDRSYNLLHVDLTADVGNFRRFSIIIDFSGWKRIIIPISTNFFVSWTQPGLDLKQTEKIKITIQKTVAGTQEGTILINNIEILGLTS